MGDTLNNSDSQQPRENRKIINHITKELDMIIRRILGVLFTLFGIYIIIDSLEYASFGLFTVVFSLILFVIAFAFLNYDTKKSIANRAKVEAEKLEKQSNKKSVFNSAD